MDKIKKVSLSKYFWILSSICFVDLTSTAIGIKTDCLFEANPYLVWTLNIGLWFFVLYKIALQGAGITILEWHYGKTQESVYYKFCIIAYFVGWVSFFVYYNLM